MILTDEYLYPRTMWVPLWAYIELRAEAGHDPSSELMCMLNPNLMVRVGYGSAEVLGLEDQ